MAGVSLDLGFLSILRNEAQSRADGAALAAATGLDGTASGLDAAREGVRRRLAEWKTPEGARKEIGVAFSANGVSWQAAPGRAAGVRYVQVTVELRDIGLNFMPAVAPSQRGRVEARAVAAREPVTAIDALGGAMLPYALPETAVAAGGAVTLLAGAGGGCPGASGPPGQYVQEATPRAVADAIESSVAVRAIKPGRPVIPSDGLRDEQAESLTRRARRDTNESASTYAEYLQKPGNGQRLGAVATVGGGGVVTGFATVFLPVRQAAAGAPLCAEVASAPPPGVARLVR